MTPQEQAIKLYSEMDGNKDHANVCINYMIASTSKKFWYEVRTGLEIILISTLEEAAEFFLPRFKGMEKIEQAKDIDSFSMFCHSQLSGGIGGIIRNTFDLWNDESILHKHFKQVYKCNHPDDMSDIIIRRIYEKLTEFKEQIGEREYDSTDDTNEHRWRVQELIGNFCECLRENGSVHDMSKLEEPEKSAFDKYTPQLKQLTYGSPEYKESLKGLGVALKHHYEHNSHHPEYHENGIDGMNLMEIVEMFFDWKAAGERHANGNIYKSLEVNKERFGISDQLLQIFKNTADCLGFPTPNIIDNE